MKGQLTTGRLKLCPEVDRSGTPARWAASLMVSSAGIMYPLSGKIYISVPGQTRSKVLAGMHDGHGLIATLSRAVRSAPWPYWSRQGHATAVAFFNDPNLLSVRPTALTSSVRDRQNLNAGVSSCASIRTCRNPPKPKSTRRPAQAYEQAEARQSRKARGAARRPAEASGLNHARHRREAAERSPSSPRL